MAFKYVFNDHQNLKKLNILIKYPKKGFLFIFVYHRRTRVFYYRSKISTIEVESALHSEKYMQFRVQNFFFCETNYNKIKFYLIITGHKTHTKDN